MKALKSNLTFGDILKLGFLVCFLLTHSIQALSEISLPKLISDGAILQRDTPLKIWGWADTGEAVELQFNNESYEAKTDQSGNWVIILPAQKAGGPYQMTFIGKNQISLNDILFGEVWLCSGQSNMELTMKRLRDKYPEVIVKSKNDMIRQFLVPDQYDFISENKDLESGSWKAANTDNIFDFSGVAYFFACALYDKYQVPIGLINSAMGGSPVEAWMSEDALKEFPETFAELQRFKDKDLIKDIQQKDKSRRDGWYQDLNEKDLGFVSGEEWFLDKTDDSKWAEMHVPNFWENQGLENTNGVVWFRKTIDVSKAMLGKKAKLWLGRIVDQDHVYVNGEYVGSTGYQYPPRKYQVPLDLLREGKNTITVRIINEQSKGGFILDKPYFLSAGDHSINLIGKWKYRLGTTMTPLASQTFIRWKPGGLYNKMIAPLTNYKIKGVIWYQGESNTGNPSGYAATFPAMINNWRESWQIGNFPFLYVQLASFMKSTTEPVESNWAELRQAQLGTLSTPNTGMVVTTDLGEWNDIHPHNKKDVGERLAQLAYKLAYNETGTKSSPTPKSHSFHKNKVKIDFYNDGAKLRSINGQSLHGFEISDDGKNFYKADAKVKGNGVVVCHKKIKNPIAVRYAWSNNPVLANLFSSNGLPVSPFEIRK